MKIRLVRKSQIIVNREAIHGLMTAIEIAMNILEKKELSVADREQLKEINSHIESATAILKQINKPPD